jgi:flagellum-specific peptidoglycan hydrolase FlgJ
MKKINEIIDKNNQNENVSDENNTISRRQMLKYLWASAVLGVLSWTVWYQIDKHIKKSQELEIEDTYCHQETQKLTQQYSLTFKTGDTARWLLKNLYEALTLDKNMATIYSDNSIKDLEKNNNLDSETLKKIRFNLFFIAVQSDIFFLQGHEQDIFTWYKQGDVIRITPSQILTSIATNPDTWREERKLRLYAHAKEKKQWWWSNVHQPSVTEIRQQAKKSKKQQETPSPSTADTPTIAINRPHTPKESSPTFTQRKAYIQRFEKLARSEMQKYDIPASIKLAQAILESKQGKSELTQETNNHFWMKCRTHTHTNKKKRITKKHYYINNALCCSNRADDHQYDMFKVYPNAWSSFRDHSSLLAWTTRYAFLTWDNDNRTDWQKHFTTIYPKKNIWVYTIRKNQRRAAYNHRSSPHKKRAYGLAAMWYATSRTYPEKLIKLIEEWNLTQFDK